MKLLHRILNRMDLSPNRRKVVENVSWAVLGKIVTMASGLLVGVLVARYLGPDQFGLMNYVLSYVTLFSVLASFGLDNIEIRELAKPGVRKETILGTSFAIRLVFAVVTILLILVTLLLFEADRYTSSMIMVYSLSLIFRTLMVIRNYFTAIVENEYIVKAEITRSLIGSGLKVVLLLGHCSLTWFIVATAFDTVLVGGGYLYAYRKRAGRIRAWKVDASVAWMLIREAFPLLLSGTAVVVYQRIDTVMIRNMIGNASAGQFSVAARVMELAVFIPVVIAQTVTPLLVVAHQGDVKQYGPKRQQFMDVMVWSSVAVACSVSILAGPAIRLLFGEEYLLAIPVLQIMAWKTVFVALSAGSGQLIIVEGIHRYAVIRNLMGGVACVFLNLLLIPHYGIVGSAIAAVLTMAVSGYLSHVLIKPYRPLLPLQTRALVHGWKRVLDLPSLLKRKG